MSKKKQEYGNESIQVLEGEDRVRKRPAVIFGSDGLDGCEHAVFEIVSNAIDEAREKHGDLIIVTRYADRSVEVEDFGRGCPVDWNESVGRYNWELVFCEMYAGGKYNNNQSSGNYEYSLGLNGLGTCATQYASEYFDAVIHRDGFKYTLHFKKGRISGKMLKEPTDRKKTGSLFHWKPDLEVFTDIDIPVEYYTDMLKRQAVVNAGVTFRFRNPSPCRSIGRPNASAATAPTWTTIRSKSRRPCALPSRAATSSITTTPPGWNTAARRKRRLRTHLSMPLTPISSRRTNTPKTKARSPTRT